MSLFDFCHSTALLIGSQKTCHHVALFSLNQGKPDCRRKVLKTRISVLVYQSETESEMTHSDVLCVSQVQY